MLDEISLTTPDEGVSSHSSMAKPNPNANATKKPSLRGPTKLLRAISMIQESDDPESQKSSQQRVISTRMTADPDESIDTETPDLIAPKLVRRERRRIEEDLNLN